jgi:hypothetical protein
MKHFKFTLRDLFWLVLAMAWLLVSVALGQAEEDGAVDRLVEQFQRMPGMPLRSPFREEDEDDLASRRADAAQLAAVMAATDDQSLDNTRAALEKFRRSKKNYDDEKGFMINQYVFEIPREGDPESKHVVPCFVVLKPKGYILNESWPWVKSEDGSIKCELLPVGLIRNGPPYAVLEVFDSYRKHFGRRKR